MSTVAECIYPSVRSSVSEGTASLCRHIKDGLHTTVRPSNSKLSSQKMATPAKYGLFVFMTARSDAAPGAITSFLQDRHAVVCASEPDILQWFAVKVDQTHCLVFSTFATEAARQAYINNAARNPENVAQRNALFLGGNGSSETVATDLLPFHKITIPHGASGVTQGLTCGIRSVWTVKEEYVDTVKGQLKNFSSTLLGLSESPVWFGYLTPGTTQFGVFVLFQNEAEKDAHVAAHVTEAKGTYGHQWTVPPETVHFDVLSAKV